MIETAIARHIHMLAHEIGCRPVGWEANRRAAAYIAAELAGAGCRVAQATFDCLDWKFQAGVLRLAGQDWAVRANPFSPPCRVAAPILIAASLGELEAADMADKIIVLHGDLSAEPIFPKNFRFFSIEEHQRIIAALERGQPAAIIAVSPSNDNPPPVFEDGDFTLPSITTPARIGEILLGQAGALATLEIDSVLQPARGENVVGRKGAATDRRAADDRRAATKRRVVICAHFDTKHTTPGALDNAAGVAALLALAEIAEPPPGLSLEFVAFNGEECYATPGQIAYLDQNAGRFGDMALNINIDGVGLKGGGNTIAFFGCPDEFTARVRGALAGWPALAETEPWPQSDHTMFAMQGVPAVAFTSDDVMAQINTLIHTPADTIDIVSTQSIANVVDFVREVLLPAAR